ncbi:AAA family ATPase [Solicola gregarius]|uniref:Helicase RepA family protein n=1 Tax=Solicola gregarius TaxID=2908642 RepID=A0AA46THL4_9ACTN|nr:AAA family ATPase [Solicola gregarius]UYM05461.1 helicase RepA family protein [Solicola gregarius]
MIDVKYPLPARQPYPPFKDPDDWRGSRETTASESRGALIRQVVDDATANHIGKHVHRDHPWCIHCDVRIQTNGAPPPEPHKLARWLRDTLDDAQITVTPDQMERVEEAWSRDELADTQDGYGIPAGFGIPDEAIPAINEFLNGLDRHAAQHSEARYDARARATRYLILNNRPPVDDYDPDEDEAKFDAEFLQRDELDDLPEAEPLIEGIIPRHAYGILRGRDGTYKSFVALDWALCLATGRPWQGRYVEQVPVLYIAGEGAYGLASRVTAWEQANDLKVDTEWFVVRRSALNLHKPGPAFDHLLAHVEDGNYGLVIVDTLRRVAGAADGNGSEMGAVVDNLDRIKRATDEGSALALAHTDKGDNDTRGYSGIEDDADFVWHAKRDEANLELTNTKMKDGPDGVTVHLRTSSVAGSLVLVGSDGIDTSKTTESQLTLLDTLRNTFPDGAHTSPLMKASGLPERTYYRAIAELRDAGHVTNTGTKQRPFHELVRSEDCHPLPSEETPLTCTTATTATTAIKPGDTATTATPLIGGSGSQVAGTEEEAS